MVAASPSFPPPSLLSRIFPAAGHQPHVRDRHHRPMLAYYRTDRSGSLIAGCAAPSNGKTRSSWRTMGTDGFEDRPMLQVSTNPAPPESLTSGDRPGDFRSTGAKRTTLQNHPLEVSMRPITLIELLALASRPHHAPATNLGGRPSGCTTFQQRFPVHVGAATTAPTARPGLREAHPQLRHAVLQRCSTALGTGLSIDAKTRSTADVVHVTPGMMASRVRQAPYPVGRIKMKSPDRDRRHMGQT